MIVPVTRRGRTNSFERGRRRRRKSPWSAPQRTVASHTKRGGGGAGRQKEEKSLPVKFHRLKIFRCSTPCHHHLILSFSRLSSPRAPGKCTKRKKRREKNSSPQVGPSYAEREREKGRLAIAQGRLLKSTGKEKWNEKRIEGERETVEGIEPAILEASVVQQLASKHLVFFRDSSKFYFINFHHIFAKYESPDGLAEKFRYVIELKNKGGWRQTARRLQSQCAAPRHLGIFPPLRRREKKAWSFVANSSVEIWKRRRCLVRLIRFRWPRSPPWSPWRWSPSPSPQIIGVGLPSTVSNSR